MICGVVICWSGFLPWRCCGCGGVGLPRWNSGVRARGAGRVGRLREIFCRKFGLAQRLRCYPRAALINADRAAILFSRLLLGGESLDGTCSRPMEHAISVRWPGVLARVGQSCSRTDAFWPYFHLRRVAENGVVELAGVNWLRDSCVGGEMREASRLLCRVLKWLGVFVRRSSARRLGNAASDRRSRSV